MSTGAGAGAPSAVADGAGWEGCALVVPAGGSSVRMGSDKLSMPLGASTVLGETLTRVPRSVPVAVVGPARRLPPVARPGRVVAAREDPPGGGPAAAVAAGLRALHAAGALDGADVLVVCAGDAPWSPMAVPTLVSALREDPGAGCALALDGAGHRQPLLAAHRLAALRQRLSGEGPGGGEDGRSRGGGGVAGRSARWLAGEAPLEVAVADHLLVDVDTPEALAAARARAAPPA